MQKVQKVQNTPKGKSPGDQKEEAAQKWAGSWPEGVTFHYSPEPGHFWTGCLLKNVEPVHSQKREYTQKWVKRGRQITAP